MRREMEDIDKMIREALSEDEAQFYEELNEPDVLNKLGEVYKGRLGWLAMLMNLVMLLLFIVFIYSLISIIGVSDTPELIRWATFGILSLMGIGILKLYFWMQMDKNDLKRELKRIELQIAALSGKLAK